MSEKMYKISEHIIICATGITADANTLIDFAREQTLLYFKDFGTPIVVDQLINQICDYKQIHTQMGSLRPYGVSFLYAGYDKLKKFQLLCSDPSGNYSHWKADVIGTNNANGISLLKDEYKDEINMEQGLKLAIKVLCKTLDTSNPKAEEFEVITLTLKNAEPYYYALKENDIKSLIEKAGIEIKK